MQAYNLLIMEFREFFAKRLKAARMERGLTQARLGELSSVHKKAIAKYEAGDVIPTVETLQRIALALDVSGDYFLLDSATLEGVPRVKDPDLYERYSQLESLGKDERAAIVVLLDALIEQKRIREITSGKRAPTSPAGGPEQDSATA